MVDGYNMDKSTTRYWESQVSLAVMLHVAVMSGHWLDNYVGKCGHVCTLIQWPSLYKFFYWCVNNFHSCSRPWLTAKYYFHDLWYITANKVAQMLCTISRENYYPLRSGWSGTLYQLPISTSKLIGVWLVYHLEYHNIVMLYNFGINLLTLAWTFLLS